MNWADWIYYFLTAFVLLLSALQIVLDYRLKNIVKDGRTTEHKRLRVVLLWLTLILFIGNQVVGAYSALQKEKASQHDRMILVQKIDTLSSQAANSSLKIGTLTAQTRGLYSVLATNRSIDIPTRSAIIESERQFKTIDPDMPELDQWLIELQSIQHEQLVAKDAAHKAAINDEKELKKKIIDRSFGGLNYVVEKLQLLLADVEKGDGHSISSSYHGFPDAMPLSGDFTNSLGQIIVGSDPNHRVDISFSADTSRASLVISSFGKSSKVPDVCLTVNMDSEWSNVMTTLEFPDGPPGENTPIQAGTRGPEGYKKMVDEFLHLFIAAALGQESHRTNY